MSRLHVHIAVADLETNIRFYTALFGHEPSMHKNDYAKWELTDPAVNFAISSRGRKTGLDHVGIQAGSGEEFAALQARLEAAGIAGAPQEDAACCYAHSDKYWSLDPQGIAWEAFHTLDTIPTFNDGDDRATGDSCCVVPGLAGSGCCS
ncbi:MAG: ArsI/CadI family heavy metal resistance metalloenzyme [Pseudomonadota bacterium]